MVDLSKYYKLGGVALAPENERGAAVQAGPVEYQAFQETSDLIRRLWFKCGAAQGDAMLPYNQLGPVHTDTWSRIGLEYPGLHALVDIHGEYLTDLARALQNDGVAWVQVFEENKHIRPKEGTPIILSIEVKFFAHQAVETSPSESDAKH